MRLVLFFLILIAPFNNSLLIGKEAHLLDEESRKQESKKLKEIFGMYLKDWGNLELNQGPGHA